jgi:hypothetical protein
MSRRQSDGHHRPRWAVTLGTVLVLCAASQARAQSTQASAPLTVTVVVVQSCSVVTSDTPQPGNPSLPSTPGADPRVQLKCGKQLLVYPLQPGVDPTPLNKMSTTMTSSGGGKTVTIQF